MSLLRTQELADRGVQTWVGPKAITRAGGQTVELVQMSPQMPIYWVSDAVFNVITLCC